MALRFRLGVAVVGVLTVSVAWLFVDLGGSVAGRPHPSSVIPIALWAGPFLLYGKQLRTAVISVLGGLALLASAIGMLIPLLRTTSSTAGVGVLFGAVYMYGGVALLIILDRVLERRGGQPGSAIGLPLASVSSRFVARLIDLVCLLPVGALFFTGIWPGSMPWLAVAAPCLLVLYEVSMTAVRGQTIGKIAMSIRVVREAGDARGIGWGPALLRVLLPAVGVAFPVLPFLVVVPYLWAVGDPQRRGLHDQIARTVVVRAGASRRAADRELV